MDISFACLFCLCVGSCRVRFLLEALTAIKNNNVHKLLDIDQQQQLIRLQKLLRTYTRGYSKILVLVNSQSNH